VHCHIDVCLSPVALYTLNCQPQPIHTSHQLLQKDTREAERGKKRREEEKGREGGSTEKEERKRRER